MLSLIETDRLRPNRAKLQARYLDKNGINGSIAFESSSKQKLPVDSKTFFLKISPVSSLNKIVSRKSCINSMKQRFNKPLLEFLRCNSILFLNYITEYYSTILKINLSPVWNLLLINSPFVKYKISRKM